MKFAKSIKKWFGRKRRAVNSFFRANFSWAGSYLSVSTLKKRRWNSALILKIARDTVDRNENEDYPGSIRVRLVGEIDTNQFLANNLHPPGYTPYGVPNETMGSCPVECKKDGVTITRGIPVKTNREIVSKKPAVVPLKPPVVPIKPAVVSATVKEVKDNA